MSTLLKTMNTNTIQSIISKNGYICSTDLKDTGITRTSLNYLSNKGILRRIARGVYTSIDESMTYEAYAEIMLTAPRSVICLLSALQFHEITTQMPYNTWIAIDKNDTRPNIKNIRLNKFSGKAFSEGIETYTDRALTVRVYCPAKTVVDCFKFRNKIGIDIAIEALTDSLNQKKATKDEIWHYAKICRMSNVIRPYLEMC